jgi:hypothetical protein
MPLAKNKTMDGELHIPLVEVEGVHARVYHAESSPAVACAC